MVLLLDLYEYQQKEEGEEMTDAMTKEEIKTNLEKMCKHLAVAREIFEMIRDNAKNGDWKTFDVLCFCMNEHRAELHAYNSDEDVIEFTDELSREDTEYPKERFTFVNGIKVFRLVHQTEIESEAM